MNRNRHLLPGLLATFLATSCFLLGCNGSQTQDDRTANSKPGEVLAGDAEQEASPPETSARPKEQESANEVASTGSGNALITAKDLKRLIDSGNDIRIIEPAKSKESFLEGHLPSAQFLHWVTDMTDPANQDRYNIPTTQQFERLMSRLGIKNDTSIVIYDRMDCRLSTRLFWTFKYFGHTDVRILDGGITVWESKFGTATDSQAPEQSKYKVEVVNREIFVEFEHIKTHLGDANYKFVDGRPTKQYSGEEAGKVFHTHEPHQKKGHIPGAVNVFWKDNFNKDGTFKSATELRKLYLDAEIHPDDCVVTYCNEGLHAAPPWFVLTQLLNYGNVKLYDDSMAEWANADNPMETVVEKSKE